MNNNVAVRHLVPGNVLVGSGFTVTNFPWRGVGCPARKTWVEGFYPGGPVVRREWNPSTIVQILP